MTHPELPTEQAYIDRAYEALEEMRAGARLLYESVIGSSRGGTHSSRFERDVFVETSLRRLAQLEIGQHALCFGRIDDEDDATLYIGRLAVSSPEREALVVDWRAPASEPFYRATGRDALGLTRRRHFFCEGQRLIAIEDERFDSDEELALAGPGALLAALGRERTGRMRDIVATIQREQDEVIRDDLHGALVVQGGPGTGKTAVLLHRVAYLLFTHRRYLEGRGVLVIGPNQVFLRYIDQVLPALGESGAALTTIAGLRRDVIVRATESPDAARVKGDARMRELIARAVADRERFLARDAQIPFEPEPLVLSVRASEAIASRARGTHGSHNARRAYVEDAVFRRLYSQYAAGLRGQQGVERISRAAFVRAVRREPELRRTLDRMWPRLEAAELIHDLLGSRPLLASAAKGILSDAEQALLFRPHVASLREVAWTRADVPLVDEAAALLGLARQPSREREGDEEDASAEDLGFPLYGHIAVDEAQDLSPMELRMLGRRSLSGSMTIVGDVAQATAAWAPSSWQEILLHLPLPHGARTRELTINYRTPREVMDVAGRLLRATVPHLRPPESIRSVGEGPSYVRAAWGDLGASVVRVASAEQRTVAPGIVAVITSRDFLDERVDALRAAGVDAEGAGDEGLRASVTVLPLDLAKGLEFDSVVVEEPARLVRESREGLRALYVAMTRTTRRLVLVHADALPEEIVAAESSTTS